MGTNQCKSYFEGHRCDRSEGHEGQHMWHNYDAISSQNERSGDELFWTDEFVTNQLLHKLSPEEMDKFSLKCVICGTPIHPVRAKRQKKTCCEEHTQILRQYTRHRRSLIECPSCGRPSTPAERMDFKRWRAHRGDVLKSIGRGAPRKTREKLLESDINQVISEMKAAAALPEPPDAGVLRHFIAALEKIVAPTGDA